MTHPTGRPPEEETPEPFTLEEVVRQIRVAEKFLKPHRSWGECPMSGEEECCDTLVQELRMLRRVKITIEALTRTAKKP